MPGSPRHWHPPDGDGEPPRRWVRRDHEWSWGGDHAPGLSRFERIVRTWIRWAWVVAFVVILIAYLTR